MGQGIRRGTGCTWSLADVFAALPLHVLRLATAGLACPFLVSIDQLQRLTCGYNTLQGQQGGAPGAGAPGADGPGGADGKKPGDDNVVDAEFTDSDK